MNIFCSIFYFSPFWHLEEFLHENNDSEQNDNKRKLIPLEYYSVPKAILKTMPQAMCHFTDKKIESRYHWAKSENVLALLVRGRTRL